MADCDFTTVTELYLGYDNAVTVVPYSDIVERTVYDLTNVTEIQGQMDLITSIATGDSINASSNDVPTVIFWEQVGTEWRINFKAGLFVGITAGQYDLRIILFDAAHPNGLVLADDVRVDIVDIP